MYSINNALAKYPEFLSSQDLVSLGIYASIHSAYEARKHGLTPPYVKLSHKILYPKTAVIEFLEQRLHMNMPNVINTEEI